MTLLARVPPSSDFDNYRQIFEEETYSPLVTASRDGDVTRIVDLGANVGYASAYFAEKFPRAKIVAVEPDKDNLRMLHLNVGFGGHVDIRKGAVWSKSVQLSVTNNFRDCKDWAKQVVEDYKGDVKGYTINELCPEPIDILKIDIEGAEFELFKEPSFLERTKVVGIEIHSDCGNPEIIYSALRQYGFAFFQKGETTIAISQ